MVSFAGSGLQMISKNKMGSLGNPMSEMSTWKPLYQIGGIAALVAGVLFRRNIGAEVSLFIGVGAIPQSATDWFVLLQTNPFVGLSFLAVFDLVNYALVGLVFLALCVSFWQTHKSIAAIALTSGLIGIAVSFASNISLTMLSLSHQYAAAASETKRAALLAAGQTILATNDPLTLHPGTGTYVGFLLITLACLLFALLMLRLHKAAAIIGLLAGGCDMVYCLTFALAPSLQVVWIASGGLFWMIWHLLVGRVLLQRLKE